MVLAGAWRLRIDDLVTVPGLVVVALAFLTVAVSHIVSVIFLKLVTIDFFAEFFFPELNRFVDSKSKPLQV